MSDKKRPRDGSTLSRVRAVSRAIAILRTFKPEEPHLPLTEIAQRTELDIGTVRRILITLCDNELVRHDKLTGLYSMTLGILQLASAVPESGSLKGLTESRIMALAAEAQVTAYLSVEHEGSAICLARHHGKNAVQVQWWGVGGAMPLNCGAAPKLLFAFLPEERRKTLLENGFEQLNERSVCDPKILRTELNTISLQGWALAQDDIFEGLSALAAPLRNGAGDVIAAISISGLTSQILGDGEPRLLPLLLEYSNELSDRLRHYGGDAFK